MHQPAVSVDTDVGFHSEVPLIALLGLVHLGIARARAVLRRTGSCNQRGIDHRAALEQQPLVQKDCVDRGENLRAQIVRFEQMPKAQDGRLVRQAIPTDLKTCELLEQQHVVQRLFHRRVRQAEPLLKEVNTQHRLHRERRTPGLARRRVRCNQRNELRPWHHPVHLFEELALARSLARHLESRTANADLLHRLSLSQQRPRRGTFADYP